MLHTQSPATLAGWLTQLESQHPQEIDLGLDRIQAVASRLGLTTPYRVITVAGTNGKGSVCAMLEAILEAAGYSTACYTSPHLVHFNERIRVRTKPASDEAIIAQFERIEQARAEISLTYFEFATLAALLLFQEANVDIAILEVGLGGRLDAVNIVDADCAVVTSIDIDHTGYLGETRDAIAWEKAHIFRPGKPAICADPVPPPSLIQHAQKVGADLWLFGKDFNYSGDQLQWAYGGRSQRRGALGYPALRGANQLLNASAALAAIEAMQPHLVVPAHALRLGLLHAALPGRFQILPGEPTVILDVAHNPHAAAALGQNLGHMPITGKTHAVIGMFHDKDVTGVLEHLVSHVDYWYCATLGLPRTLSAEALAGLVDRIRREHASKPADRQAMSAGPPDAAPAPNGQRPAVRPGVRARRALVDTEILTFDDPVSAFQAAQESASVNDRIVVSGSFATVGPVLGSLNNAN